MKPSEKPNPNEIGFACRVRSHTPVGFKLLCGVSIIGLTLGGCVPKDGPTSGAVNSGATTAYRDSKSVGYMLVDLNGPMTASANDVTTAAKLRFPPMPRGTGGDVSIGVGDLVAVTIFESDAGGLFIPKEAGSRAGNFVEIPRQQVDARGSISIPYIDGPVQVAGRTTRAVGQEIASKLKNRAIEPQAVVSVVERNANDVSVLGELNLPVKFSLDPGGVTLLNAIARAGGPKLPDYETTVSLQRGGVTRRAWLSAIVRDPSQNISLRPGDVVYLAREQRVYMTLGSTPSPGSIGGTNNRRFPFEAETMTLAEAVAKAGGLDTSRADPKAVFLYRFEPKSTLARAGLDVSKFPGTVVPTIYRSDLQQGGGFFLANSFLIRDKDIIFVSEDPVSEFNKFTAALGGLTGNVATGTGIALDVQSLRR